MSVLVALIAVIPMQHATTLKEVTPALATLGTQAMDFLIQVSATIYNNVMYYTCTYFIPGNCHQNCHNSEVIISCSAYNNLLLALCACFTAKLMSRKKKLK